MKLKVHFWTGMFISITGIDKKHPKYHFYIYPNSLWDNTINLTIPQLKNIIKELEKKIKSHKNENSYHNHPHWTLILISLKYVLKWKEGVRI